MRTTERTRKLGWRPRAGKDFRPRCGYPEPLCASQPQEESRYGTPVCGIGGSGVGQACLILASPGANLTSAFLQT